MNTVKIYTKVIDVHGYLTLAVYFGYFIPGSLRIHTKHYTVRLDLLKELLDKVHPDPLTLGLTRRWLPQGEIPFPGYCRAPGTSQCLPALCNCEKLIERWNVMVWQNLKGKEELLKLDKKKKNKSEEKIKSKLKDKANVKLKDKTNTKLKDKLKSKLKHKKKNKIKSNDKEENETKSQEKTT